MPSLRYIFSESLWNTREFFRNPRKIYAIFPALTIFAFWRVINEYQKAIDYVPQNSALLLRMFSVFTMAFAFIACYFGSRLILKSKPRFWLAKYLVTIGIAISPISLFLRFDLDGTVADATILFLRLIIFVAIPESIAGFLIAKIQKRPMELESHQESLVLAEEKFRASVSRHLHDNLQTRLVAIGIQLNQIRNAVDEDNSRKILSIISEIETLRSSGVRDFSKSITPNIAQEGLEVCVERLLSDYENVISSNLHNIAVLDLDAQIRDHFGLGTYRIIEQALLNSLTHGKATEFEVDASCSSDEIYLKITNNGSLFEAHHAIQGHGFAVIDAWVKKFAGTWNISNYQGKVLIELSWKI
jgi:glucose-6-phosphate-specific signal transduction histidine kinase